MGVLMHVAYGKQFVQACIKIHIMKVIQIRNVQAAFPKMNKRAVPNKAVQGYIFSQNKQPCMHGYQALHSKHSVVASVSHSKCKTRVFSQETVLLLSPVGESSARKQFYCCLLLGRVQPGNSSIAVSCWGEFSQETVLLLSPVGESSDRKQFYCGLLLGRVQTGNSSIAVSCWGEFRQETVILLSPVGESSTRQLMNTYISVLSYDLKKCFHSTVYVCEVSSVLRNEVTDNNNRFGMCVNDRVCVCVCACVFCECIIVMQLTTVYIQSSTTYVTCCTPVSSRLSSLVCLFIHNNCLTINSGTRQLSGRMPDSQPTDPALESPLLLFQSLGIFVLFMTPQSTQLYK